MQYFTYRSSTERLVHIVDVVIDVIVVEIIAGGIGRVVVARVIIRVIPIVVLAVLVQHHRGEHVGCAHDTRAKCRGMISPKKSHCILTVARFVA